MSAGIVEVEIELKEGKLPDAGVWLALHEQRVADGCKRVAVRIHAPQVVVGRLVPTLDPAQADAGE